MVGYLRGLAARGHRATFPSLRSSRLLVEPVAATLRAFDLAA